MFSWKKARYAAALLCALLLEAACGDTYRPVANPIVSPGGDSQTTHYAYVLYTNPNGPGGGLGDGTLQQIDVSGDSVTLQVQVGRNPLFAAFFGISTSEIFTANQSDGTVTEQTFFQANPPSVVTLPPTSTPVAMGGTSTSSIYVVDSTAPAVCPNGAVNVVSSGNVVSSTVCVGKNPVYLAQQPNGGKVYVVNQGDNTVSVIDPVGASVIATIPVGIHPVWVTSNLDGSFIFIVNEGSNSLTAIHTIDNTTTTIPVGTSPNFSIFDSHRNRLYVTNGGTNDVSVLDLSQATPIMLNQHVGLGANALNPTQLVPLVDGTKYYVVNTTSNNVSVLDASSNTLIGTANNPISLGTPVSTAQPLSIEADPTSSKVFVTTPAPAGTPPTNNPNAAPGVTIIRTATNTIESFVQAPQSDPNCQPNPVATPPVTCSFQTPLQVLTYVHN